VHPAAVSRLEKDAAAAVSRPEEDAAAVKKLLVGCGVVAGVLIVVLLLFGFLTTTWVKKSIPTHDLKAARATLRERFGDSDSFVPALDGHLDPARLETFVATRESLLARRTELGSRLTTFAVTVREKRETHHDWVQRGLDALSMAQGGVGLYGSVVAYLQSYTDRLLAAGMGEGEYAYLYSLAYFSWLQWDPLGKPADVEAFRKMGIEEQVLEAWRERGRTLRHQLENAQGALQQKPQRTRAEEATLALLGPEIEAARASGRFPFAGHVPAAWATVLEPYRARLMATQPHTAAEAALELVRVADHNDRGFQFHMSFDDSTRSHRRH
jgi:hypothetical protein